MKLTNLSLLGRFHFVNFSLFCQRRSWRLLALALFLLGTFSLSARAEVRVPSSSPYGTCSHLAAGEEHQQMPQNFILMRAAGIEWARADFSWSGVESPKGNWHFEHLDRVVDEAAKHGITILPILDYHTAWADPAFQHPEEWLEYVRRTVTHFKDRIRYWEVWNEENLKGFWHDTPDPAAYAELLKRTYQTIKAIDPDLVVVYGGLAGVPFDFYEKSLQAGAGNCFDVANIHPYRGGLIFAAAIDGFLADLQKFHDLTVQYCGKKKPLWITEMGWATPPELCQNVKSMIGGSLRKLFPDGVPGQIGVISDPNYAPSFGLSEVTWAGMLPSNASFSVLTLEALASLNVQEIPVLILPPGEEFPTSCKEELLSYVREGGTLVMLGGIPFYYHLERGEDGVWQKPAKGRNFGNVAQEFRVNWIAWWTEKGTPEKTAIRFAPEAADAMSAYPVQKTQGSRYFTDRFLKEGDSMEPLLIPADAQWTDGPQKGSAFTAPCACIYRFRSDWKGNLVVSAVMGDGLGNTNRCIEENQGVFLSQAILLALANGVERYFNYEFQAPERDAVDPESHFGITHADLTPKSGYLAYQALTKARPAGSVNLPGAWNAAGESLCVLSWKRPDGQTAYAVWATSRSAKKRLIQVTGTLTDCFNYLGEKVSVSDSMEFKAGITYFVGKDLKIEFPADFTKN